MADKKPRYYSAVTPKGEAVYPRVNKPDTKFNAAGVFSTKLVLSSADATPLMEAIDKEAEAALEAARQTLEDKIATSKGKDLVKAKQALEELTAGPLPYEPEYDDDGEETGRYVFSFKTNASYTDRKTNKTVNKTVPMFDVKGKKIDESVKPQVWGGSILKVDFTASHYYNASAKTAGVSLRINAIQICELVTGSGGSGRFGEEEGNYEAPEAQEGSSFSDEQGTEQAGDSSADADQF